MSSERLSRALLTAAPILGQMGQMAWQRSMAEAADARQENLMRLRHSQDVELAGRREQHDFSMEDTRQKNNLAAAEVEHGYRAKEIEGNQAFQREQTEDAQKFQAGLASREESLTRERWTREDRTNVERAAITQINEIDDRILKLTDSLSEAEMKGEVMDPAGAQRIKDEISSLRAQRGTVRQEMVFRLADMGDPRYRRVEAPAAGKGGEKKPDTAAQAPEPESIAAPPPAPSEERAKRKERGRQLLTAEDPVTKTRRQDQSRAQTSADETDMFKRVSKSLHGQGEQDKAIAEAASQAIIHNRPVDPQVKEALRKMSPSRRRQYLSESELARLGL